MIWHITKKEFHQNLITSRFIIGSILSIIFMIAVTVALLSEYETKVNAYNKSVNENEQNFKQYYTYSEIKPTVHKPPEILSILSEGMSNKLGGVIHITRNEIPTYSKHYVMDNPLLKVFQSIDITLVFTLVLSLLALLFAFDMFCGEKEKGTLKLMLSGKTSRAEVFFGKYLGGILSLTLILVISFLIVLLILLISPAANINTVVFARILLFYLISLIFVASFFSIGALISSLTHRSVTSLALCLFTWVVLVIALPNLGDYTVKQFKTVPPLREVEKEVNSAFSKMRETVIEYMKKNEPQGGTVISGTTNSLTGYYKFIIANLNQMKFYEHFIPYSEKKRLELANEVYAIRKNFEDKLLHQAKLVNFSTIFSPVRLYEIASKSLARTDIKNHLNFLEQARTYRDQMLQYFDDKDVYNKYRFVTIMKKGEAPDVTSASVFQEGSEGDKIWEATRKRIRSENRPPLNLEDFPRFHYKPLTLTKSIYYVLPYFAALVLIVSVLTLITYFCFVKYDVR